jgi:hypothetical protein
VTHQFHPLFGQEFELVTYRHNGRVFYYEDRGCLIGLPAEWTDAEASDPFVVVSAGRSRFRVEDLVRLVQLIAEIESSRVN